MDLILAEKPSVAKLIASALGARGHHNGYITGGQYIITWAYGHLLTLYDMEDYDSKYSQWSLQYFPFVPHRYQYKPITGKRNSKYKGNSQKQQLDLIKSLVNQTSISKVIIATDYDREGQVIADSILTYVGCSKPTYRMLLNEWTPKSIIGELEHLTPNSDMKLLSEAGFCRQQVDWLIGINWTSVTTLVFDKNTTFNVGRVILPTLKILYDREQEKINFREQKNYSLFVNSNPPTDGESIPFLYSQDGQSRFLDRQVLENAQRKYLRGKKLTITDVEEKEEVIYPKLFFNLTSLQMHISSKYSGWTADKVLSVCQKLYERQYITYPRTESSYLDESSIGKTKGILENIKKGIADPLIKEQLNFKGGKSIFNNEKVHSHGAIIPTYIIPVDLDEQEKLIYSEIYKRFLSKFMPESVNIVTTLHCVVSKNEEFSAKIVQLRKPGWQLIYGKKGDYTKLPYNQGDVLVVHTTGIKEEFTKPPADHTESSILRIMEHCGKTNLENADVLLGYSIGTPATRSSVLSKIKQVGYVEQAGKFLKLTTKGRYLIEHFPNRHLLNLDFTGKLELLLYNVENGECKREDIQKSLTELMINGVDKLKCIQGRDIVSICPHCGNFIVSGKQGYGCLGFTEGCKFSIITSELEEALQCSFSNEMMVKLIRGQRVCYKEVEGIRYHVFYTVEDDGSPLFDLATSKDNGLENSLDAKQLSGELINHF